MYHVHRLSKRIRYTKIRISGELSNGKLTLALCLAFADIEEEIDAHMHIGKIRVKTHVRHLFCHSPTPTKQLIDQQNPHSNT